MTQVQVNVAIGGADVPAGTLYSHRRRGAESATFVYATRYLATPGAYAIDPELPLTSGAHVPAAEPGDRIGYLSAMTMLEA